MHCLDSQTVSEYISTIVPDDNEKRSINEKLDILLVLPVKVVSIHKASNFFTMDELKKSVQGGLQFIQSLLSVGIRSYFTQRDVCGR